MKRCSWVQFGYLFLICLTIFGNFSSNRVVNTLALAGSDAPPVNPSQLLIATIIDPSSAEIIRDAFTLIRSMRLFGGRMNEATFLAGITGSAEDAFIDRNGLIGGLLELGVELTFVQRAPPTLAKTLNKFRMFIDFDSTRFDYFLWLDADILVLGDPMPYLRMHAYPGHIDCVLDLYSYMRRYPAMNSTASMYNTALAVVELLGEGEISAHAACNTGVLFFDSLSLKAFTNELSQLWRWESNHTKSEEVPQKLSVTSILDKYGSDRFVDSLLFVYIVNRVGLEVSLLPHEINYMPFFEVELQQDVPTINKIVFAHLLAETSVYCKIVNKEGSIDYNQLHRQQDSHDLSRIYNSNHHDCSCQYRTKEILPSSLMRDYVNELLRLEYCLVLSGAAMPAGFDRLQSRHGTSRGHLTESVGSVGYSTVDGVGDAIKCSFQQPHVSSSDGWFMRIDSVEENIELDVGIVCQSMSKGDMLRFTNRILSGNDTQRRAVVHESTIEILAGGGNPLNLCYRLQFSISPTAESMDHAYPNPVHRFLLEVNVVDTARTIKPWDSALPFVVAVTDQQSEALISYDWNMLRGTKPIALESQLLLPQYLNAHKVMGTGVVLCCDSVRGMETALQLIRHWKGANLLFLAKSDVVQEQHLQLKETISNLTAACKDYSTYNIRCYIVEAPIHVDIVALINKLAEATPTGKIDFVYSDVAEAYSSFAASWLTWYKAVRRGGLLIGSSSYQRHLTSSRFSPSHDWQLESTIKGDSASNSAYQGHKSCMRLDNDEHLRLPQGHNSSFSFDELQSSLIEAVVEKIAMECRQQPLFTYDESSDIFCASLMLKWGVPSPRESKECSPAWYMHKLSRY